MKGGSLGPQKRYSKQKRFQLKESVSQGNPMNQSTNVCRSTDKSLDSLGLEEEEEARMASFNTMLKAGTSIRYKKSAHFYGRVSKTVNSKKMYF